jgi:hypothetical protein
MSNITINNVSAANSAAIYLTGGGTGDPNGRADGLNMDGILVSSSSNALGTRHGIVIDGSVFTLNGRKVLLTHVDGHALWLRIASARHMRRNSSTSMTWSPSSPVEPPSTPRLDPFITSPMHNCTGRCPNRMS